jgi:hypothetical protein
MSQIISIVQNCVAASGGKMSFLVIFKVVFWIIDRKFTQGMNVINSIKGIDIDFICGHKLI